MHQADIHHPYGHLVPIRANKRLDVLAIRTRLHFLVIGSDPGIDIEIHTTDRRVAR